jgi:dipeptide/tripeptide permease
MAEDVLPAPDKPSWRFPGTFWIANGAELCERAAYYGMFITLVRYLNEMVGFSDVRALTLAGLFSSILYLLPTFMGIMADKIGFKRALMLAFALLTAGYALLGLFQFKITAVLALVVIMFGGAVIKPVISGTAAKCSTDANRARAMSIFYMVVNIGSFSGKFLAGDLNDRLGLQYINYYAAGMAFAAFILVAGFYRNPDTRGIGKTVSQALRGLFKVMGNFRFLSLILIVAGFWAIQGQLYGLMPTYMERLIGPGTKPEWLANINPAVVVLLVVPITHFVRNFKPENAIGIGLFIIPFTALVIALSPVLQSLTGLSIGGSITTMVCIGVALQGLAECFLSPKFLEYASKQAPEGEVGLYLGYQHLTTFFAWLFGFILTGYLLNFFCPDPLTLPKKDRRQWREAIDPGYMFVSDLVPEDEVEQFVFGDGLRELFREHGMVPAEPFIVKPHKTKKNVWSVQAGEKTYVLESDEIKSEELAESLGEDHPPMVEIVVSSDSGIRAGPRGELPKVYDRAHWSWYAFTIVGVAAFIALLIFKYVTNAIDRRTAAETDTTVP